MTDDTLTAAVARLRADANKYPWLSQSHDIIAILAALAAAQADARLATETLTQIRDSTYRNATTLRVIAARALDAAMKGEGDGATAAPSEPTASVTDGPAADPIADLCARLRDYTAPDYIDGVPTACEQDRAMLEAADALERQASEIADLNRAWKAMLDRAERAEAERDAAQRESEEQARLLGMSGSREAALLAERDALRECVRAADGLRAECDQVPPMVQQRNVLHAYDAARAKVTLP